MSAIYFCSYETIETINSTLFKVEIDDIRKKLPHLKDKSDKEIIEEVKGNSITFEDLEIEDVEENYDESNSIKGDDMTNSIDGDVHSSDELDDYTPQMGPFYHQLGDEDKKYIDENSWKDYLENKMPKFELTIDDDDE
jgi:hypothetical protein|tara:strand:- start:4357 stop:4770 length:414 start_codon:yes stop_codon:yes gene_type:complete